VTLWTSQQAQVKQQSTLKVCGVEVNHHGISVLVKNMRTQPTHKTTDTTQAKVLIRGLKDS
jgi:hypothetical protein